MSFLQQIDVRTVMIVSATITLLLAACLGFGLRHHLPRIGRAAVLWVAATAVQPVAWLLFSQRGTWPDLLSSVLGNALMLWAYASYLRAIRMFTGYRGSAALPYGLAALGLLLITCFTYIWPSVAGRIIAVSPVTAAIFGLSAAALINGAPRPVSASYAITTITFLVGAVLLLVRTFYEALAGPELGTLLTTTPMQVLVFGYASLMPVLASFGFVLMCNDRSQADLERLAATDPLTGVLNRRMLEQLVSAQLADARRHLQPLSLALLDADHFKDLNDAHGHDAGDEALRTLVATLRPLLRPTDLIGRLGGEEFLVVLGATPGPMALTIAERIRASIAEAPIAWGNLRLSMSVSIGVATQTEQDPDDFMALVRRADSAMYQAKRAGRNCVRANPPAESA